MKDALGHGSDADGVLQSQLRARLPHVSILKGGGIPHSSNASAAASLMGALQRTQAPVHPSMGNDRSSEIAYNRDLAFRVRNKMVGSGMKAR